MKVMYEGKAQTREGEPTVTDLNHYQDAVEYQLDDWEILLLQRDDIRTITGMWVWPMKKPDRRDAEGFPKTTFYAVLGPKMYEAYAASIDWASYGFKPDKIIASPARFELTDSTDWDYEGTTPYYNNRIKLTAKDLLQGAPDDAGNITVTRQGLALPPPPPPPGTEEFPWWIVAVLAAVAIIIALLWLILSGKLHLPRPAPAAAAPAVTA